MKKSIFTILLACAAMIASAQIKKPELMVIPSDAWCITNGYYTEVENLGKIEKVPNYKQALQENMGLKLAIAKLNDLMAERQFPLQSLEQTIKNLEQRRMEDNLTTSKAGNELAESPLDEVARIAKCDIILELSWEVKDMGPKHSISYILEGRDAYTAKTIGAASGTGAPSFTADVDVLLEEAIVANMDNFNNRLMDHFQEMQDIGREIILDIKVFANNERGIDLESEFDGEEHKASNKPSALYSEARLNQIRQYDAIKNEYAMKHGIPLVRIPYSEKGAITLDLLFSDKYLVSA